MRRTDIPLSLLVVANRQAGLVSTTQCEDAGLDRDRRHRLVRDGRAVAATRRVLDLEPALTAEDFPHEPSQDRRRRRAAFLALLAHGPDAIAVGQCALALHGIQGLPLAIRPEVALPTGRGRAARDGLVVRRFSGDIPTVAIAGFRVAEPRWALAEALCEMTRDHAVAVLDSAIQLGALRETELSAIRRLTRGRRGAARLHDWWALVDGRAQSPLETFARLCCVDAGLPPDDLQVPLRDRAGRIVARGDLGWHLSERRWLIAEIDGAGPHSGPDALYEDRRRQNAVVATGMVDMLRFTAKDLAASGSFAATIRAHLAQDALRARPETAR